MAIDRTPSLDFRSGALSSPAPTVTPEEPESEGEENVAAVQQMLSLFAQHSPHEYAALNLTPGVIANQIIWDEEAQAIYLPVIGANREKTTAALDAWRSFVQFFAGNTTDQEYDLQLYRPEQ